VTRAAQNCSGVALFPGPDFGLVPGDLGVTLETGVIPAATLEPDRDNVAIGLVMRALSPFVNINALCCDPRFHRRYKSMSTVRRSAKKKKSGSRFHVSRSLAFR
jgi:hypothetical protein